MHWFKKTMICAAVGALSATANGQERTGSAVRLGTPTPLDSPGIVRAFVPVASDTPSIQQASFQQPARPRVVRGVGPMLDDEPREHFLPRNLPPLDESKLMGPPAPLPAKATDRVAPPAKDGTEMQKTFAVSTTQKLVVVAESPPTETITTVSVDKIIIVDDAGNPLIDSNFGAPSRFYARAEYLLWWTRGFRLPPLVITDSAAVPIATRGLLGNGTTQILFGDSVTSAGPTSGGRFTFGYNFDPCGLCALEGTFFFLGRKNDNAFFSSNQFPVLGRPFFDLNDGIPNRELTTSPDQGPGTVFAGVGFVKVDTSSTLFGAEANLRSLLWCECQWKVSGLVGFRYLNLNENLTITEGTTFLRPVPLNPPDVPFNAGDRYTLTDSFSTRNQFFGGQIGLVADMQRERWTLEGSLKLAIGATYSTVDIDGRSRLDSVNGGVQNFVGGLYAVPSNIGHHTQTRFSFVPEVGINLGYRLTDNLSVFAGYNVLYWTSVLRPGDQIDPVIDLNQVPQSGRPYPPATQVRPRVPFQTSSFWAQGVNAGLMFRY